MKNRLSIRLHEVSVRRASRWVLKGISWQLRSGGRWVLTGPNGAGKTQLLKLLAGDVWPTPTGCERIEYALGKRAIEPIDAKRLMAYLGAERQDRYARYAWDLTVRDLLASGLHGTDILLEPVTLAQRRRVRRMLVRCALNSLAARKFSSLSYGQQRLALLARALIGKPHWLLLDEFYNGLDAKFRRKVDAILDKARRAGQSWVVAAHRSIDVPRGTHWLIRLSEGGIVCRQRLSARELQHLDAEKAAVIRPARAARLGMVADDRREPLVRLRNADLYVNYRCVLRSVNWELHRGEHWAVVGENGSGKSSFLKMIYGDLAPAQGGRIERAGLGRGAPIELWKRHVAYISPNLQSDYAIDATIEELVASGRHASVGLNEPMSAEDRRAARAWLRRFKLAALASARPRQLSYGELRRALFARAMAASADIVLFDEPLTGLDPAQRVLMRGLLEDLGSRNVSLVMAVHHWNDLPSGMTHCLYLHNRQARSEKLRYATQVVGAPARNER